MESQAKRQVEQSGLSESLGDPQRSSELARRYTELYDSSVLQLLDQLDSFDNLTEDDLNHFALEIFKVTYCEHFLHIKLHVVITSSVTARNGTVA